MIDGASFWVPRRYKRREVVEPERVDVTAAPALVLPDCPPAERAAACAALDELHRTRPLKPPTRRL